MTDFATLAAAARPINDGDWGTDRQINAENAFFEAFFGEYPNLDTDDFTSFCIKATADERIDEALRLIKGC